MAGKVISFINMKGGVAKTTLTKEIGILLSSDNYNKKVLLVDLDPQANLTQSIFEIYDVIDTSKVSTVKDMHDKVENLPSINNLYNESKVTPPDKDKLIVELTPTLSIIPGSLDSIFYGKNSNGDTEQSLRNTIQAYNLTGDGVFDFILIDCPPTYSSYTISAALASDFYIIPVKPDAYSALGIDLLSEVIDKIKGTFVDTFSIKPIHNLGIIFTKYDKKASREAAIKSDIENSDHFSKFHKFSSVFPKQDGLATQRLNYVISNGNNTTLKDAIYEITAELLQEIEKYDESQKSNH